MQPDGTAIIKKVLMSSLSPPAPGSSGGFFISFLRKFSQACAHAVQYADVYFISHLKKIITYGIYYYGSNGANESNC
jgi:hypothetical protein